MSAEPDGLEGLEPLGPAVESQPSFPAIEQEVLDFWRRDGTFRASVEANPGGDNEYVFYDGPPFATGLPHYGHLLTGFVKDAIPRFQTMRGRRVERRFGWDCHGLPAEVQAERELGLAGRAEVIAHGIDRFNAHCRALVQRTTDQWEHYVTRQARWVDFSDDYKTMDLSYMESVIWAFKQLWDKGLAYEGHRVLPYCWECETPLSNFETRQDDAYRTRTDPAVTVSFEIEPSSSSPGDAAAGALHALVWTTTPWTLPSNLALAVGPDTDYVVLDAGDRRYLVSEATVPTFGPLVGDPPVIDRIRGRDLAGRRYSPLFGFFARQPNAFKVLTAQFVATDEGTGIVHLAPGFGEEDQLACEGAGIAIVCPVDNRGRFTEEVPPYEDRQVFDANPSVISDLKAAGHLVDQRPYSHSYPHCWRTDTPLIYKAVSSWFIRVTRLRDRMVELNQSIEWVPAHVRDGAFGKWLEGARDWSVSRNRFWGTPIPVWKSDDPRYPRIDVYGSLDELQRDFGVRPADLHRPVIDDLTRPNPDDPTGASTMRRIEDVLDCWFDSGSMPFAQLHYPFENRERFEAHFPADFIVEYVSQTRGWFYTLHVLSTALFDCPPFNTCIAHGIVRGHDGRKLSKRLGNYPDPLEVFDTLGADAMRWFLLSSSVLRGQDLLVDRRSIEDTLRQVISPVWSTWYFYNLYSGTDRIEGRHRVDQPGMLDRYILAKTAHLVADVTRAIDTYDLFGACASVTNYLDALTNWYIRRSRERFWRPVPSDRDADRDKNDAYDTLATVLEVLTRLCSPLLPLVCEAIYRPLTGRRSVHLEPWPVAGELPEDPGLVRSMDRVRDICSAAHSVRKAQGLRLRLPLASLTVFAPDSANLEPFRDLIAAEANVKQVNLSDAVGERADFVLAVDPAAVGPRLGPRTQKVLAATKRGEWSRGADGKTFEVAGETLSVGEAVLRLRPRDPASGRALPDHGGIVALDLATTPELEDEGLARDVVRHVQNRRRDQALHVADHIRLFLQAPDGVARAIESHRAYVAEQTLADEMVVTRSPDPGPGAAATTADGQTLWIEVERL